jgi:hypothetical protein
LFAAVVAQELRLALLEPPFAWLPKLDANYLQRQVQFATLQEARQIRQPAFVKPADDKCFLAGVFQSGDQLPRGEILQGSIPVLVAEPVRWEVEFRCFVLEREIVAISPYLRKGELVQTPDGGWQDDRTEEAKCFGQRMVSDGSVALPPALALDVGIIEGRGWAVIEANAAWGSGIYGCDPAEVLRVVRRACLPRDRISAEDRCWVIDRSAS